jgi:triacylglycerol lipase
MAIKLQYPIVLVHGIIAHDRKGLIDFWGRIPDVLKQQGLEVFFGNTDAWGTYQSNAAILKTTIEQVLVKTGAEKVNIIAHSKGGIDSRYMIWHYDFGDKVASVTTISTPHHGAELADYAYAQEVVHSKTAKEIWKVLGEWWGDVQPDMYQAGYQLTTEHMTGFNEKVLPDSRVYYQCRYTVLSNPFSDLWLYETYKYIQSISGDNDGVVSARSASWGDNVAQIPGGISHHEIVDMKKTLISGVDIPSIYLDIVAGLQEKGF